MNVDKTTLFHWITLQSLASDKLEEIAKDLHMYYYEKTESEFYVVEQQIIRDTMHDCKLQTKKLKALTSHKNIAHEKEKKELNDFIMKCRKFGKSFNFEQTTDAKKFLDDYIQKNLIIN